MIQHICDNLYKLEIPLLGNPLKAINSYVMISDDRNLIIDTGFNMPECLDAMLFGIGKLGIDMAKTDVLATHFHADHTGLISKIISDTSKVYMGRIDREIFINIMLDSDAYWSFDERKYAREGYPERELEKTRMSNPARKLVSDGLFEIEPLDDGSKIICGDMHWNVVLTPGHTPGHICLYEPNHKILITGDHVLFDITPNITWWKEMDDSLSNYFVSLDKVSELDVCIALTSHRGNDGSFVERILELKKHHADRLNDVLDIVYKNPYISGYDIASKMIWSIRAKNWADFPPGQRWFAVGEAIAHVEHLVLLGRLERHGAGGVNTYRCV